MPTVEDLADSGNHHLLQENDKNFTTRSPDVVAAVGKELENTQISLRYLRYLTSLRNSPARGRGNAAKIAGVVRSMLERAGYQQN